MQKCVCGVFAVCLRCQARVIKQKLFVSKDIVPVDTPLTTGSHQIFTSYSKLHVCRKISMSSSDRRRSPQGMISVDDSDDVVWISIVTIWLSLMAAK